MPPVPFMTEILYRVLHTINKDAVSKVLERHMYLLTFIVTSDIGDTPVVVALE